MSKGKHQTRYHVSLEPIQKGLKEMEDNIFTNDTLERAIERQYKGTMKLKKLIGVY